MTGPQESKGWMPPDLKEVYEEHCAKVEHEWEAVALPMLTALGWDSPEFEALLRGELDGSK